MNDFRENKNAQIKQLNELKDELNEYYKKKLKNTDPIENSAHRILHEAVQKIEDELYELSK
jgi:hypothetical protein